MPFAAMSLGLGRTGKRAGLGLIGWARGSTLRAAFAAAGTVAVIAGATYVLLPNGDYEPIRPGERGTIGEAVKSLPKTVGGRPSFTPEREAKYEAVPTERERRTPLREPGERGAPAPEREATGERDEPTTPAGEDRPASNDGDSPAPSSQGGSAAPGTAPAGERPGGRGAREHRRADRHRNPDRDAHAHGNADRHADSDPGAGGNALDTCPLMARAGCWRVCDGRCRHG